MADTNVSIKDASGATVPIDTQTGAVGQRRRPGRRCWVHLDTPSAVSPR
jgi:hypothetical protein